ncbi:MAG TPA: 50S ribosomal protein L21 [Ignavibacteriales bacterium]|jgi:large subunit ribosomal protein L21|nr:50S ribosomal protein L21 [Ignavibacteriales bacterium]
MYAIVNIAGQQVKVEEGKYYFVPRLSAEKDAEVVFDKVLLVDNENNVKVGVPTIEGAKVSAKVLEHLKDEKVLVFKKKRVISYQKLNGHRQYLSKILVTKIEN